MRITLPLTTIAIVLMAAQAATANTPTIRLFPTTVVEDLRQTGNVARDMETGLQEVIGRLDQQQELYLETKCNGAEDDPGCQRLAKQIGATYLEMLTIMEERLPDMEHTVNNTRKSLEKGLRNELGKKMTPWKLQETLIGASASQQYAGEEARLACICASSQIRIGRERAVVIGIGLPSQGLGGGAGGIRGMRGASNHGVNARPPLALPRTLPPCQVSCDWGEDNSSGNCPPGPPRIQ